jgi:SAM-dependent methyltransferase
VPILLPEPDSVTIRVEEGLTVRDGYDPWVHRMIIQSLTDEQVVVEAGCGHLRLDDPCIVRMDVSLTPYVDVVGDLLALPFSADSLDAVCATAVFEHLKNPFTAAAEVRRALRPGGYVYADSSFLVPFHGCPDHYFNMSLAGLKEVFSGFRELRSGVPPFQMPSFALQSVVSSYLSRFVARTAPELELVADLFRVLDHPIRSFDHKFGPETAPAIAAGVYFAGVKQDRSGDTVIPAPLLELRSRNPELRSRYPEPLDLTVPDNLMVWAAREGRRSHPEIEGYFAGLSPFAKRPGVSDRTYIHGLEPIGHPDQARFIGPGPSPPGLDGWALVRQKLRALLARIDRKLLSLF